MSATILVVDDEPDLEELVRQQFRRQIRQGEMQFRFAADGEEALSILREVSDIELVLSDINMPRMDGLTLLSYLKDIGRQVRAVIVSAYGDMGNIRTAMNRGAFDFLTKPIDFEDLEVTINKTLADLKAIREEHELREVAERARINLSRYFSPNLVDQLAGDPGFMDLGGEWKKLSFLFTDLTDFTPLVESLDAGVIVPLLNEYLDQITRIVFKHGGTIDKIVGDAVHAMFGAPLEQSDHAGRAVRCAMALDVFAESFRREKNEAGIMLGATRIGVHSGPAIVGNFGGEFFYDYTAHGDTINTVSRIEQANKYLNTRICVSEVSARQIPDFKGRPVGSIRLQGKTDTIMVYEPLVAAVADGDSAHAYARAFAKLEAEDPAATQAFARVLAEFGDDTLATFHLKRLLAGEKGTQIEFNEK